MTVNIVFIFVHILKYAQNHYLLSIWLRPAALHASLSAGSCKTRYTFRHFFSSKFGDAKVMYKGGN